MSAFVIDHDYHIHSQLSSCSRDPEQTPERILKYAEGNGFREICLTDHFWDEAVPGASGWYAPQNLAHIKEALPLPQSDKVRFLFGCETDMDKFFTVGISEKTCLEMDFIIVPTTHLHMSGFTIDASVGLGDDENAIIIRTDLYVERFRRLLEYDLPFRKVGIAHLSCGLVCKNPPGSILKVLAGIPDETFRELFTKTAKLGMGVELNLNPNLFEGENKREQFRPYFIAKECGCKFYFGSDAHHPAGLDGAFARFTAISEYLGLEESDKFAPARI